MLSATSGLDQDHGQHPNFFQKRIISSLQIIHKKSFINILQVASKKRLLIASKLLTKKLHWLPPSYFQKRIIDSFQVASKKGSSIASKLLPRVGPNLQMASKNGTSPANAWIIAQLNWFAYLWFCICQSKDVKDIVKQAGATVPCFMYFQETKILSRSRMPKTVNHTKMLEFFQSPEGYKNR